jgi:hypothetical protein
METGMRYAPSTLRKHAWVLRLYEGFCSTSRAAPWPLQGRKVSAFLRFLAQDAGYALGSIEDVMAPALKRLHQEHTGTPVPTDVSQFMTEALRQIKREGQAAGTREDLGGGREPAIVPDVQRIIEHTPEGIPSRAEEASLWLVALSTGARAVTCESVTLQDISQVHRLPNSDRIIVQLRYRVTKGNGNWNHLVSLEGSPVEASPLDVVYWLRRHLLQAFSLDLLRFAWWQLSPEAQRKPLWHWKCDAMRELFKTRATDAGFPRGLFGFHSLRGGFICSALLRAGSDANAVRAVLENTALVAGWRPYQAAQLRYMRASARQTIVATRLIMPPQAGQAGNPVEASLTTSEAFHGIHLAEPRRQERANYRTFFSQVNTHFKQEGARRGRAPDEAALESLRLKCWAFAFERFVMAKPELEEEANALARAQPRWSMPQYRSWILQRYRAVVGRRHIQRLLTDDYSRLAGLVHTFLLSTGYRLEHVPEGRPPRRRRPRPVPDAAAVAAQVIRERMPHSGHRRRMRWTRSEDRILVSGRSRGEAWLVISRRLEHRDNVDCKDRWRTLLRNHGDEAAIFRHFEVADTDLDAEGEAEDLEVREGEF